MTLPDPYVAVVMALGVFRLTRLVGWDAFPPAERLRHRLLRTTVDRSLTQRQETRVYRYGRPTLAAAIQCPYCGGFWIGLATWGLWLVFPTLTVWLLAPFALNAVVGTWARMLDP